MRQQAIPSFLPYLQYPLAKKKVRYVGEPVAVVVAESRYLAEDALELIQVEYEPLPAVADIRSALAEGAVLIHEETQSNLAGRGGFDLGGVDRAFQGAAVTVAGRFAIQRHTDRKSVV